MSTTSDSRTSPTPTGRSLSAATRVGSAQYEPLLRKTRDVVADGGDPLLAARKLGNLAPYCERIKARWWA